MAHLRTAGVQNPPTSVADLVGNCLRAQKVAHDQLPGCDQPPVHPIELSDEFRFRESAIWSRMCATVTNLLESTHYKWISDPIRLARRRSTMTAALDHAERWTEGVPLASEDRIGFTIAVADRYNSEMLRQNRQLQLEIDAAVKPAQHEAMQMMGAYMRAWLKKVVLSDDYKEADVLAFVSILFSSMRCYVSDFESHTAFPVLKACVPVIFNINALAFNFCLPFARKRAVRRTRDRYYYAYSNFPMVALRHFVEVGNLASVVKWYKRSHYKPKTVEDHNGRQIANENGAIEGYEGQDGFKGICQILYQALIFRKAHIIKWACEHEHMTEMYAADAQSYFVNRHLIGRSALNNGVPVDVLKLLFHKVGKKPAYKEPHHPHSPPLRRELRRLWIRWHCWEHVRKVHRIWNYGWWWLEHHEMVQMRAVTDEDGNALLLGDGAKRERDEAEKDAGNTQYVEEKKQRREAGEGPSNQGSRYVPWSELDESTRVGAVSTIDKAVEVADRAEIKASKYDFAISDDED